MEYGELMKDIRFENDIKQNEMAKILGISRSAYNNYEQQYNIIPLKYLIVFANHFNISIDYLLGLSKEKNNYNKININHKNIGINLRKVRRDNKLTQLELAQKLHIANSLLSSYEKGRYLISTASLYSICKLFNTKADYLLNRHENEYINNKKDRENTILN